MIEKILPASVACAEEFGDLPDAELPPEEAAVVARAVTGRRLEFTTARSCARSALRRLGATPTPILKGEHGVPLWPPGIVGSITHCAGFRAAAVARSHDMLTIGIDAEPHAALPDGVLRLVALPAELALLRDLKAAAPTTCWDRLLFSAKESVYKAWFPLTRRWLSFKDAEITFNATESNPTEGTVHARLRVPTQLDDGSDLRGLTGRWLACSELVATVIMVPTAAL